MRFLIDHQLPAEVARFLTEKGVEAQHVSQVNLERASDRSIWAYAEERGFAIVSKDEDFFYLATLTEAGPRLIWVRLGNCRKRALLEALERAWPRLRSWMDSDERVIELR